MHRSFLSGRMTILLLLVSTLLTYAQPAAVLTGYVTDAATGKPMPFANVYINGSTRGTSTDEKGFYTLTGVPQGTVEVAASFVGYQSASRKIRFDSPAPQKADFQLKVSEQTLEAVTVRANPKLRERHLRQFKRLFFGEPFGGQCVLVNSDALHFKEEKEYLYATATEPLLIDNQATGYRVIYDLQHFEAPPSGGILVAGTARFEELKPEDERQANRFRRNRIIAYNGSIRHLMASLITNTTEQAGFQVYQEDVTKPVSLDARSVTLSAMVNDYKRLVAVKGPALILPGRLPSERRLVSPMKLIVFYTKATSEFSPYPDARYAYTEIKLPAGQLQMTVDGVITMPESMEAKGSMGNDRLSSLLPADWKPDGGNKDAAAGSSLATQGRLAPPDARMGRITEAFNERFKVLSPTAFVHIDKPFYATGDRIWMSVYLLDAATHQRAGGETALHVDLLTPAGKAVQHQWIRIAEGRGEGTFRLSDTLRTGTYRLRAYTDDDDAQQRPSFERSVAVYNLFRNDAAAQADSAPKQADVQVLPEGGRWIAGLPARLGVKIVRPDGRGLAIAGRIVDDQGAEITRFMTSQQGMTSVLLEPKPQRTYYADVTYNNQLQHVPLPAPEAEGLLLTADAISDTTQLALTIRSTGKAAADSAYILIQQHGRVVDQRKVILQNGLAKVGLPMMSWLPGLAQITVYDAVARPQAERLIFVPEFVAPVRVLTGFNKNRYQPREQVLLSINLSDNGSPALAALSASVTDAGKVPDDTTAATVHTHLLLTGELRGHVENPGQYLLNRSAETRKALDDLLLTQGWRRVSGTPDTQQSGGISLMGRILNPKNDPMPGAQVMVMATALGKSFVKSAGADEQGRFRLAGLTIKDTIQLVAQLTDRQLKNLAPKDARLVLETPGSGWERGKTIPVPDWSAMRAQLEAARTRQQADTDFYRDKTMKVLAEVTVRAQKQADRPNDVNMRSLHNTADAVLVFDDKIPAYSNLYEMIQGRLAGVTVSRNVAPPGGTTVHGYQVFMRGGSSIKSGTKPLFLMDGVPIQDPDGNALMNFNSSDIERVEVLKSAGAAGMYGAQGANGVIAFYTKTTRSMQAGAKAPPTMKPIQFIGYPSVQREFYVPRYDTEAATGTISGPVDQRDVLYWKPIMQTDGQGRSQLRFPLSDVVQTVRVVIQGITADGRPVSVVQLVRVQ